jgi:hypothetical protein
LTLAGWDTAAFSNGNGTTGIHHPDGSFKRISFGSISGSSTNYWNTTWTSGVTEPGSSGSPIFDSAHRIRGQLFGGASSCTNQSGVDTYGRFNVTHPIIRRWLEVGGTINVNSSYIGTEEGTPTRPFRTASAAHTFAWNDTRIKFRTGSYPGAVTFSIGFITKQCPVSRQRASAPGHGALFLGARILCLLSLAFALHSIDQSSAPLASSLPTPAQVVQIRA